MNKIRKIKRKGKVYEYANTPVSAVIEPELKKRLIKRRKDGYQSFTSQINEALRIYLKKGD